MQAKKNYKKSKEKKKDTVHVVEKRSVFQATLITDLIQEIVKGPLLSGPTKL